MKAGFRVGQYVLERPLGAGGMAEVWLGRNLHIGTPAAIKFLNVQYSSNKEIEGRFLDEGRRQGSLVHPNIVQVYGFEYIGPQGFLVLQYIDGETLEARLRRGPIGDEELLRISSGVLSGLGLAHAAEIVHRDIKPSNILLDRQGQPHVSDFGIVRAKNEASKTRTGVLMGTVFYMSPEQISRPKDVDHRSDIYSFGCVLFEMVTGRVPFGSDSDRDSSEFTVQLAHVQTPPPSPRSFNSAVRPAVEAVILKCLAKEPSQRYSTCAELQDALARAVAEQPPLSHQKTILETRSMGTSTTPIAVSLVELGPNKIGVIKVVREFTGLGLKDANDLVENRPSLIKYGVSADEAAAIRAKLTAEGATVSIGPLPGPAGRDPQEIPQVRRRSIPVLALVAAAAVLLVLVGAALYLKSDSKSPTSEAHQVSIQNPPTPTAETVLLITCDVDCVRYIDGISEHSGPIHVAPGPHRVRVAASGDSTTDSERTVNAVAGKQNDVSFSLRSIKEANTAKAAEEARQQEVAKQQEAGRQQDAIKQQENRMQGNESPINPERDAALSKLDAEYRVQRKKIEDDAFRTKAQKVTDLASLDRSHESDRSRILSRSTQEANRRQVDSNLAQAKTQYRNQQYAAALDSLDRVLAIDPNNDDAKVLKTQVQGTCEPIDLCGPKYGRH